MATYHPSRKLSKLDKPDMQDTAGEARTSSWMMYSYGPPTNGRAKAGRPTRTYIQLLCEDTGWSPEDLPEAMNDREEWRERVRDIRADDKTWWWWWWWYIYIYIYILFFIYIYIYIYSLFKSTRSTRKSASHFSCRCYLYKTCYISDKKVNCLRYWDKPRVFLYSF